jgi:hypothetical protein
MADCLSSADARAFRTILGSIAERSSVGTAVLYRDGTPWIYFKDGLIWTSWAKKYPIEEARGWVVWSIKTGSWRPYRPKVPAVIDLPKADDGGSANVLT